MTSVADSLPTPAAVAADGQARPDSAHPRSGRGRPLGGSERKGLAIRQAALRLFLRDGFARTSVDAIAEEAGVSKRTIYNHYADKQALFLSVISQTFDSLVATVSGFMDEYLTDVPDDQLEQRIIAFSRQTVLLAARTPERAQLIRLMMAEAPHFPELRLHQLRPRGITANLAGRLATLSARGLLDVPEPEEAANHLFALTMGQVNNRSIYGILDLTDEEIIHQATSGARAFLRAYRPR